MTINDFITRLVAEIEIILKDVSFVDYQGKQASIKGYPYELPFHPVSVGWDPEREEPDRELAVFPYFLVQIDEIEYEEESAVAKVWILLAARDENMEMTGWNDWISSDNPSARDREARKASPPESVLTLLTVPL